MILTVNTKKATLKGSKVIPVNDKESGSAPAFSLLVLESIHIWETASHVHSSCFLPTRGEELNRVDGCDSHVLLWGGMCGIE